jgi:hypothetical protein
MIEPIAGDVGRGVVYRDRSGAKVDEGVITRISPQYVFVRYGADKHSKATRREDLEWVNA